MLKPRFNKKAVVLVIVLATILVVICFSIATLTVILSHGRFSTHQVNRVKAYYASLAGINLATEELRVGTASWKPSPDTPPNTQIKCLCNAATCPTSGTSYCNGRTADVVDADIPYNVAITVFADGTSIAGTGTGSGRKITVSVDYSSTYAY